MVACGLEAFAICVVSTDSRLPLYLIALHQRFTNPTEYNEQYRSISFNLKVTCTCAGYIECVEANLRGAGRCELSQDPQNPDLNRDLFAGVLQPEELVDMKPAEMASAALKEQREADRKWMRDATRSDWNKVLCQFRARSATLQLC